MKHVVIGATKGLGLCLTRQLLEAGHQVVAGAIVSSAELEELKAKYPQDLLVLKADVTDEEEMISVAKASAEFLGHIDTVCTRSEEHTSELQSR